MCDNSELIICVLAAIAAGRTGAVAVSGDTEAITESCVALSARPPLYIYCQPGLLLCTGQSGCSSAAENEGMKDWTRRGSHSLPSEETFWLQYNCVVRAGLHLHA